MGSIEKIADTYKQAVYIVDAWEKGAIENTDIDGPLSVFAKTSLIMKVADALAKCSESGHNSPQAQEPERRKPGRPRNVNN